MELFTWHHRADNYFHQRTKCADSAGGDTFGVETETPGAASGNLIPAGGNESAGMFQTFDTLMLLRRCKYFSDIGTQIS